MSFSKDNVFKNLIWRFLERTGAQIVQFIVSIILARVLLPEDYGTIALITVFITILNVFVDSGLGGALIQKKDTDNIDFSTVFYTNLVFCIVLYTLLFFIAPFIASFYNNEQLIPIIRVLGITILISSIKNIQQSYVSKTMQFKKFFFATLVGTILAAVIGIYMAYKGKGVWALVTQQIVNAGIDTIILWITVRWRPDFIFSFSRLRGLFSFGWKMLLSSLLAVTYNNLRQLIIGKKYTKEDLAYYNRGEQFPNVIVSNINNSIDSVLFPTLSAEQDNIPRVKEMVRRSIKTSVFLIAPLMMGLAACAPGIVRLVLTEKWSGCVPFLRIFCVTYMFYPIHTANLNAIRALGRSDIFLKLEILKKIIGFVILFSSMWFGVYVMAYCLILQDVLAQIINSYPNKKLLNYTYLEQLKDIVPSIIIAAIMGILVALLNIVNMSDILRLLIQIPSGALIYAFFSKIFKIDSFGYMINLVKEFKAKRKIVNNGAENASE